MGEQGPQEKVDMGRRQMVRDKLLQADGWTKVVLKKPVCWFGHVSPYTGNTLPHRGLDNKEEKWIMSFY